jgi:hypothetical protein
VRGKLGKRRGNGGRGGGRGEGSGEEVEQNEIEKVSCNGEGEW